MSTKPIKLENTRRAFTAARDEEGVPHIEAASWFDALYGLGYMHGTDRGTQLLFARTVASGEAAAELSDSPELLETDRFFRRTGLHVGLEAEVRNLDDDLFGQIAVYCDGVNDAIQQAGRSWPMWATGYQPGPWNHEAVLMIGKLLSFGGLAVSQMQSERLLVELVHSGADSRTLRDLFGKRLRGVNFATLRKVKIANQLSDEALELITDLPRLAGSNAWAIAPKRSASGSSILAADPHLEVNRLPAIWYETVLRWGSGQYVMGASLPGCPLFAIARNRNLAWGVTYLRGDTIDYFIEDCRAGGATGWQYRRGRQWHDFRVRTEALKRKGGSVEWLRVYENAQGALESDPEELGAGYHLSLCWSGNEPGYGKAIGTWLDVLQASETEQAMEIVRECSQPTLCWVFADKVGNIGMQSCGLFPKRGNGQIGLAPIPAWNEQNHWQGWIPYDELPRVLNPPEGYVATANEEWNPPELPMLITQPASDYRTRRIIEVLKANSSATVEDQQLLQYDLESMQARDILKEVLPLMPDCEQKEALAEWDCRYDPEGSAASLFQRLYLNIMIELLGEGRGIGWRRMLYLCSRVGYSTMILTAADRILLSKRSNWWKSLSKQEVVQRATERLKSKDAVPWSQVNNFHFADRFFGNHLVGRILGFKTQQYAMPGNHATIFQGHVLQTATREATFAPSYHFVTDLSRDEAWTNLPGGPSENRFSPFYKNDIPRWLAGEYKRLGVE